MDCSSANEIHRSLVRFRFARLQHFGFCCYNFWRQRLISVALAVRTWAAGPSWCCFACDSAWAQSWTASWSCTWALGLPWTSRTRTETAWWGVCSSWSSWLSKRVQTRVEVISRLVVVCVSSRTPRCRKLCGTSGLLFVTPHWPQYARTHISARNFLERVIDFPDYAFVGTNDCSAFQNFQNLSNWLKSGRMTFVSVICNSKQGPETSVNARGSLALSRTLHRPVTPALRKSIKLTLQSCLWQRKDVF